MRRPLFHCLRFWIWWRIADRPGICPATSHTRIVSGDRDASLRIEPRCLYEDDRLGCWCGKVNPDQREAVYIGRTKQP